MREMPDYEIEFRSREWYLYHHFKNEEPIIPLVVLSMFLLICKGGILGIVFVWTLYFIWASNNNRELDNDPEVLMHRKTYIEIHEYLKNHNYLK